MFLGTYVKTIGRWCDVITWLKDLDLINLINDVWDFDKTCWKIYLYGYD
jgi:hypothetical protein